MDDSKIIELYWSRSEEAILQTKLKYGKYCHQIAKNILYSDEDAEECVNDAYLKAWNSIPPARPERFSAFLGKITRNISLDKYDEYNAKKRSYNAQAAFEELGECIPDTSDAPFSEEFVLREAINSFLASLRKTPRIIFMRRYWYMCSISDIAASMGMSESNVKVTLMRTRKKLADFLKKEGISI